jgi:hypothetical protein
MVNRRYLVIGVMALSVVVASGMVASARSRRDPASLESAILEPPGRAFTNLKVLRGDISPKNLQHIMIDEFEDGLGVNCAFCHTRLQGSEKLDYASDTKPEKKVARNMMRMTLKLNARYFQVHRPGLGMPGLVITCTTCHQGRPRPDIAP